MNGTNNSDEHLNFYIMQVNLYTANNVVHLNVYIMQLYWFTRLPSNTIDSFETLAAHSGPQFVINRSHHLISMALVNIRQEKKEPLQI